MSQSKQHETESIRISKNVDENIKSIGDYLGNSADLIKRVFRFHKSKKIKVACFFIEGLINKQEIEKAINRIIHWADSTIEELSIPSIAEKIESAVLINTAINTTDEMEKVINMILAGETVLFFDGSDQCIIISTREWATRSVDEPQTEQVVRGPRDGFNESLRTNTALVRRRIRDPSLRIEAMVVGRKSKTDVNIVYLENTAKKSLVKEVKNRIGQIEIDAILDSGYIEELIEDAPYSPFTTIQSTERPDKVASAIYEGRVAIFVDNSPFVLIVPSYFWQFLQASDDYYLPYLTGSFDRLVRLMAFVISLTLPSVYVMLVSFHQEMIPTPLALTIASGRDVNPFPVLVEALIMEFAFELMREAGLRMPKPIGQAVSIVGSLVIGQAAVQAGLVSPFMVIIVAITGIASFAIPNYSASFSIRLIRFVILIASGTMGLLGFATSFAFFAIHAMSLRSFGESYLAPATPFKPSDQKDFLFRVPFWGMKSEPDLAKGQEDRLGEEQIPRPDNKQIPNELFNERDKEQTSSNGKVKTRRHSKRLRGKKDEK